MIRKLAIPFLTIAAALSSAAWGTTFPGTGVGVIPDGGSACGPTPGVALNVTFAVTGIVPPVNDIAVDVTLTHPFLGDLVALLIAPNGTSFVVFGRIGSTTATGVGDSSDFGGTYVFSDTATTNIWSAATAAGAAVAIPPGAYRTTMVGGAGQTNPAPFTDLDAAFASVVQPNGTWTLRLTDGCAQDFGSVTAANLTISDVIFANGFDAPN